jgi:isoleucyl-tRNA synthetase
MDRWLLSRLQQTIKESTKYLDEYKIQKSTNTIFDLISDISKWYIRRSRDRFVAGDTDALETLNYVLLEVGKVLAPFSPFLSESVYQTLVYDNSLESVHLEDYPEFNQEMYDEELLEDMESVRQICSYGLKIRDENRLKLRQPLSKAYTSIEDDSLKQIIKAELNVKEIETSKKPVEGENLVTEGNSEEYVTLDIEVTKDLKYEGYINDFLRQYQNARKRGEGIDYGDPVELTVGIKDADIKKVLESYLNENSEELSIGKIQFKEELDEKTFKLGEKEVSVEVEKV